MKIAIIGKGAAALGVVTALKEAEAPASAIDIYTNEKLGKAQNDKVSLNKIKTFYKDNLGWHIIPQKINIKKGIIDNKPIFDTSYEPLSLWGNSFIPFSENELHLLGKFSQERIYNAYKIISTVVPISGDKNDNIEKALRNTFVNQPKIEMNEKLNVMKEKLDGYWKTVSFISGYPRLSLVTNSDSYKHSQDCDCIINNCNLHKLFLASDVEEIMNSVNLPISIIRENVSKLDYKNRRLQLWDPSLTDKFSEAYDLIFVCAGAKGTLKLLKKTEPDKSLTIHDNAMYLFPIFSLAPIRKNKSNVKFSLTSLISIISSNFRDSDEKHFLQIYPFSKHLLRQTFPPFLWPLSDFMSGWLQKFIFIGMLLLDDEDCTKYFVASFGDIENYKKSWPPASQKKKVRFILSALKKKLAPHHLILKSLIKRTRTSHHFGKICVDQEPLGEYVQKLNNAGIYFCGSSIFKKLPAISPTYSIMSQSYLITEDAIKQHFSTG